jgi:hypothetical protein
MQVTRYWLILNTDTPSGDLILSNTRPENDITFQIWTKRKVGRWASNTPNKAGEIPTQAKIQGILDCTTYYKLRQVQVNLTSPERQKIWFQKIVCIFIVSNTWVTISNLKAQKLVFHQRELNRLKKINNNLDSIRCTILFCLNAFL